MKRTTRRKFLLSPAIVIAIFASALAYRNGGSESVVTTTRASEMPESEDERKTSLISTGIPVFTAASPLRYQVVKLRGQKSIKELETRLGPSAFAIVLKINRLDRKHLRANATLIVPDANADLASLSPLPRKLETARSIPKLLLVSRQAQAFGGYEFGELVYWGPTSTGKKSTPTPAGLFHTNWRKRETRSSVNPSWVLPWCFNIDNMSGVAFHKFDLPGYPASHGCVRLLEEDAKWIYEWAEPWVLSKQNNSLQAYGTPVIIFGAYAYGEKAPWERLSDDAAATAVSAGEIDGVLNRYSPTIASRARTREELIAQTVSSTK